MAIASLNLKLNDDSIITLETGTLRYIDSIIKSFTSAESLKKNPDFSDKVYGLSKEELQRSKVVLSYVKNNNEKVTLKPIYDDEQPIFIKTNFMEEEISEVEKARKLLFNSKNQLFMSMFLKHKDLVRTTFSTIKMTSLEAKKAKEAKMQVLMKDGEYRTTLKDVFKYRLEHEKMGLMRPLVEESLERWKSNLMNLSNEDLYFYCRELRLLLNDYHYRKIPRRAVCNLSLNNVKLNSIGKSYVIRIGDVNSNTKELSKRKVFIDRKSN